jgi:hypothetical protein
MASLEDTFRLMKGEKPVNTNRFTKADVATQEMKAKHSGTPSGKVTRNLWRRL